MAIEAYRTGDMTEPTWANVHYPKIDYQDIIYYAAPKSRKNAPRAWTKWTRSCFAPTRSWDSAAGAEILSGVAVTRCSTACRCHHLQEKLKAMASSSAHFRRPCRSIRSWCGSTGTVCRRRTTFRGAEFGGVQRRLVLLRAEGRALPDGAVDLLPHQRQGHRAIRAHADHRDEALM